MEESHFILIDEVVVAIILRRAGTVGGVLSDCVMAFDSFERGEAPLLLIALTL